MPSTTPPAHENEDLGFEIGGTWVGPNEGAVEYELQIYPDGVRLIVVDMDSCDEQDGEDVAPAAVVIADGLAELDHTIQILQEARAAILKQPKTRQGAPAIPDDEEEGGEGEEEEEDEEDEELEEPVPPS